METPHNRIRKPQLPVDRLSQQFGPSCQINALFHYLFTGQKKLYRYLTNEGWYKLATELMKPLDQTQELIQVNLKSEPEEYFLPQIKFKTQHIYSIIDATELSQGSDVYKFLKGKPDCLVGSSYVSEDKNQRFRAMYFKFEEFVERDIANNDVPRNDFEMIKKVYKFLFEVRDESMEDQVLELISGHSTAWVNDKMIDSNGYMGDVAPDFSYMDNPLLHCSIDYCDMSDEDLAKVPVNPELDFLDEVWNGMQRAMETGTFDFGIHEKFITPYFQKPHFKKMSRIMGLEPMAMQTLPLAKNKRRQARRFDDLPMDLGTPVKKSAKKKRRQAKRFDFPDETPKLNRKHTGKFKKFEKETPKLIAPSADEIMQSFRRRTVVPVSFAFRN